MGTIGPGCRPCRHICFRRTIFVYERYERLYVYVVGQFYLTWGKRDRVPNLRPRKSERFKFIIVKAFSLENLNPGRVQLAFSARVDSSSRGEISI